MTYSFDVSTMEQTALMGGLDVGLVKDLFKTRGLDTPLLLLSRSEVRRAIEDLRSALPRAEIFYAVKSNNHPAIIEEVFAAGGNFDVCSAGELKGVMQTGIDPKTLLHTHPIKTAEEIDLALEAGVEMFVVDNPSEIAKLKRITDRKLKILIRYRVHLNTTAVVNLQYKFGCTVDDVLALADAVREAGHVVHGLCFHIGSQCIYPENYVKAIAAGGELIDELAQAGHTIRLLDIGGGFPVPYVEPVPDIHDFCEPIREALDELIRPDIRVICEPGRFVSARAVTLVCSVIGKSERDGKMWYYLDDGIYSTFSGIVFDHCQYPVVHDSQGDEYLSVLAGPTCDSFDTLYDGLLLPELEIGDLLIFPRTGAYCAVSGSDFNSLKRPQYRVID
ncbi:MAG: type III PLP-dependent enzyme [candidate division Zixibacteria bacterium]|jgi:ornithine decarboxylase|nr:type III PLP-dependent enzyme [candidate division Zixibacteria bacterium]